MRTSIPLILSFIIGIFMMGEFFVPHWAYQEVKTNILEWGTIVAAAAFGLGLVNLIQVHLPKVLERQKEWGYNFTLLLSMTIMLLAGLIEGPTRLDDGHVYKWLYDYIFITLNATMFSLLAFYIASAAFRAFRARNLDASVLLLSACVVMLARVPIGEFIGSGISNNLALLPGIGDGLREILPEDFLIRFMNWIMDGPNVAARRAIFVGAALGAVATGLRVILGIERSHLGGD